VIKSPEFLSIFMPLSPVLLKPLIAAIGQHLRPKSERNEPLRIDPMFRDYATGWRDKHPAIKARAKPAVKQ
jgi:hypothetical protein